jgi:hypothetical protein
LCINARCEFTLYFLRLRPLTSHIQRATTSDQIFILSRILFLSTVSGPSYLVTLVDGKYNGHTIIEILGVKLEWLKLAYRAGIPFAKEGLIDILKFTFNILLHYPKVRDWLSNSEIKISDRD